VINEGVIIASGNLDAFSLRMGDCYNDTQEVQEATDSIEVESVPVVPCSEPHDNEIFQLIDLSIPNYPGDNEMNELAREECLPYFEGFVGLSYLESSLDITYLSPSLESWNTLNDREVVCVVYDMNLEKLQGSVRGRGI